MDSIINQTYENFELILVDDGSTDGSAAICDEYAKKDARIIVLHKNNAGVSEARNDGIRLSRGKYLKFVDSDDYLEPNMTEELVDAIEKYDSDLVICGFKWITDKTGECAYLGYDQVLNLNYYDFLDIFVDLNSVHLINPPGNKMYKAEIIKGSQILFEPDVDYGEDLLFNLEVFKKCNSLTVIPAFLYNYFKYDDNNHLSDKYRENLYEMHENLLEKTIAFFEDKEKYARQISHLENIVVSFAIFLVSEYAKNYNYIKFISRARAIRSSEIVARRIDDIEIELLTLRLVRILFKHRLYTAIFLYEHLKQFMKTRSPRMFIFIKKKLGA